VSIYEAGYTFCWQLLRDPFDLWLEWNKEQKGLNSGILTLSRLSRWLRNGLIVLHDLDVRNFLI